MRANSKFNSKLVFAYFVIIFLTLINNSFANIPKDKAETLKSLDEIQQMYEDYNYIDNVYDQLNDTRKVILNALGTFFALSPMSMNSDPKINQITLNNVESVRFKIDQLAVAEKEMAERKIIPRLQPMEKIVTEMIRHVYTEYDNYKETLQWLSDIKNPQHDTAVDITKTNDATMRKIQATSKMIDDKLSELDDKLSKEQTALIEYNKGLVEKVKQAIA